MDLTTMQTRCAARFRDPNNNIYTTGNWKDYLNDALQDVQATSPFWPWTETRNLTLVVNSGARSVALPTNVIGVTSVLNHTDNVPMQPFDGTAEIIRQFPTQTEQGTPYAYRVFGQTLEVYPLPSQATTLYVEYSLATAELSASGDVPPFPIQFHRILVEGALARGYTDDGAPDQAQLHQASFNALLEDLKVAELSERHDRFPGIVDSFYS